MGVDIHYNNEEKELIRKYNPHKVIEPKGGYWTLIFVLCATGKDNVDTKIVIPVYLRNLSDFEKYFKFAN